MEVRSGKSRDEAPPTSVVRFDLSPLVVRNLEEKHVKDLVCIAIIVAVAATLAATPVFRSTVGAAQGVSRT
jgi:hypothetical protein